MKSLFRVLGYVKPYKKLVIATLTFALLTTGLDLVPPWLIKILIDSLIGGSSHSGIYWLVGALVMTYLGRNYSNYKRIMFNNLVEQKVIFDLRAHVFECLQKMSLNYFENRSTGEIMSRVNDDATHVERIFIDGVEQFLTAILTLIGITTILFFMHWKLALAALIPIPFLAWGAWNYTYKSRELYYMQRERSAKLNGILQDIVSGIKETFSYNRQGHEIQRFNELSKDVCDGTLKVMSLWARHSPRMMFLGSLGTVFILFYGIDLVRTQEITVGSLVAFLGYLTLFYTPINQLHSLNNMIQQALASGKRLFEIIDAKPTVEEAPDAVLPSTNVRGAVTFREVCFSYIPNRQVLHHIDLKIMPGEKVAMVGHTGSGKSTLVKLLMRFYDVTTGKILIDDHPIRSLRVSYLREQIGLVSQEPFLFNGTVSENIRYGNLEAKDDAIHKSAQAANAEEFILKLPKGYDTLVGERGVKLSGGERHRIAIARAFLKDPPILILDEATASVDTATEESIKSALKKLMAFRTTLTIAHRLSTLEGAEKIFVLQDGRLIENGDHQTLMDRKSVYAELFKGQISL